MCGRLGTERITKIYSKVWPKFVGVPSVWRKRRYQKPILLHFRNIPCPFFNFSCFIYNALFDFFRQKFSRVPGKNYFFKTEIFYCSFCFSRSAGKYDFYLISLISRPFHASCYLTPLSTSPFPTWMYLICYYNTSRRIYTTTTKTNLCKKYLTLFSVPEFAKSVFFIYLTPPFPPPLPFPFSHICPLHWILWVFHVYGELLLWLYHKDWDKIAALQEVFLAKNRTFGSFPKIFW